MLSLLLAFLGYSIYSISLACQKIGIGLLASNRCKGGVIWASATAGTTLSSLIILLAVSLGKASIVGAMAGSGLASLALFSMLVMKEPVRRRELIGVLVILLAAGLIGGFRVDAVGARMPASRLLILFAAAAGSGGIMLLLLHGRGSRGILLCGFAGTLGGFVLLFQKASTSTVSLAGRSLAVSLLNPYTLVWILLSIASMVMLQFAYKSDRAIRIIPVNSTAYILVPVLGGVLCFGEILHPLQWTGIGGILLGVLLLTMPENAGWR